MFFSFLFTVVILQKKKVFFFFLVNTGIGPYLKSGSLFGCLLQDTRHALPVLGELKGMMCTFTLHSPPTAPSLSEARAPRVFDRQ